MRKLIPAVVFAASAAVSAPACPIGSFSAVDNLGNQICQTLDIGQTTTENCPIGTYPWVDNWGYKVCQGVTTGAQFHDASGGCPIGTYQCRWLGQQKLPTVQRWRRQSVAEPRVTEPECVTASPRH